MRLIRIYRVIPLPGRRILQQLWNEIPRLQKRKFGGSWTKCGGTLLVTKLSPFPHPCSRYLSPDIKVRRGDVLSAWSGLRPLVSNPNSTSTQALVRNHLIHSSPSGLLTIAGGKWTTYRSMAEETVDHAIKEFGLQERVTSIKCRTADLQLIGAEGWSSNMFIGLIQRVSDRTKKVLNFDGANARNSSDWRQRSRDISRTIMVTVPGPSVNTWNQQVNYGRSTAFGSQGCILVSSTRFSLLFCNTDPAHN